MKLTYLANIRLPTEKAHGKQIMKMCEAFTRLGWEVELILPRRINAITDDPFVYYALPRTFAIRRLPCLDLVRLERFLGSLWSRLVTATFLVSARAFLTFHKRDLLYTRDPLVTLLFRAVVLEVHTLPANLTGVKKEMFRKAEKLIVLTSCMKERLLGCGVARENILVAPDGVDLQEFKAQSSKLKARQEVGLPQEAFLVGYAGMLRTMEMEKGIGVAIGALRLLPDRVELVLVGGGEDEIPLYERLARSAGLTARVRFIGRVKPQAVAGYLHACDVLIAPFPDLEHYRWYMSPLKLFEYMASERPVVATDLPAIREILSEREAVLVMPGDARDLARGIEKLLAEPEYGKALAAAAFEKVKRYTWEERARRIRAFLDASARRRETKGSG